MSPASARKQSNVVDLMKSAGVYCLGVDIEFDKGREVSDRATPIDFEKMLG